MNRYFFRSADVALSSLLDKDGNAPAFSIRTRRRAWLSDAVILSADEARAIAFAILRATFVLLLAPTCLLGCQEDKERSYDLSPAGYSVAFAGYGGAPVAEVPELYRLFDEAVTRAAGELYRYGVDPASTEAVARGTGFLLIDHIRFQVPDGRWATGANFGKEIWVALHRRQSLPPGSPFPSDALPWTCLIHSSGETRFGVWTPSDTYPALGHEIGHTIFGPAFEHTYFPPVVNP